MRLPARWSWAARCECGRMVGALRWKVHKLRRGHVIGLVNRRYMGDGGYARLTPLERKHGLGQQLRWSWKSTPRRGADE